METLLILAAAVVAFLALTLVSALSARDRRPPLRTQREEDLADGDEEGFIASLTPAPASPIDRTAAILDAAPIAAALADHRLIESPRDEGGGHGTGDAQPPAPNSDRGDPHPAAPERGGR